MPETVNYTDTYLDDGNEKNLYDTRFSLFKVEKKDDKTNVDRVIFYNFIADKFFYIVKNDINESTLKIVFGPNSFNPCPTHKIGELKSILIKDSVKEMLEERQKEYEAHNEEKNRTNEQETGLRRPWLNCLNKLLLNVDPTRRRHNYYRMVNKYREPEKIQVVKKDNLVNFEFPSIAADTNNDKLGWSGTGGAVSSEILSLLHLLEYRHNVNNNFKNNVLPTLKGGFFNLGGGEKETDKKNKDMLNKEKKDSGNLNIKENTSPDKGITDDEVDRILKQGESISNEDKKEYIKLLWNYVNDKWNTYNKGGVSAGIQKLYITVKDLYNKIYPESKGGADARAAARNMDYSDDLRNTGFSYMPDWSTLLQMGYFHGEGDAETIMQTASLATAAAKAPARSGILSWLRSMFYKGVANAGNVISKGIAVGTALVSPWTIAYTVLIGLAFFFLLKLVRYVKNNEKTITKEDEEEIEQRAGKVKNELTNLIKKLMITNYSDIEWELNNYITNTRNDITIYNKLMTHADNAKQKELGVFIRKLADSVTKAVGMLELIKKNPEILNYDGNGTDVREKIRKKIGRYGTRSNKTKEKVKKAFSEVLLPFYLF